MNKELELEAEKHFKETKTEFASEALKELAFKDFIAGATSTYVEKQKLVFAIRMLKKSSYENYKILVQELEQKLSEL